MTEQEIIRILEESGALLTGHFQLRSGLHSNRFFQAALLLQYPDKAEKVCRFLADQFRGEKIDAVISPAVGGLIGPQLRRGHRRNRGDRRPVRRRCEVRRSVQECAQAVAADLPAGRVPALQRGAAGRSPGVEIRC